MPINYGTVVEGLPSSITANFVTEQVDLIGTDIPGGDVFTDSTRDIALGSSSNFWIAATEITFAELQTEFPIGTVIVQAANAASAAAATQYTVSGHTDSSSFEGIQVTPAISPNTTAGNSIFIVTQGAAVVTNPTLDNERELLYLEDTSGGIQGMLNINLNAGETSHVSILGSFPDNPADAIIEYSPKDVFGQTGTDRSIFYQGSQTNLTDASLTVRNRTLRLSGGVDINRIGSLDFEGTVVLHNTNTSGNVPYIRTRRNLSGGIENLVLDGDTAPFGIYWDQSFVGNLSPTTLALSRGLVVGNAGSSNGPFYTLVANLDATTNASTFIADSTFGITGGDSVKFDVAVATHTTRQGAQARIHDIRNSVDGLAISCAPRLIGVAEAAGRGSANITSEFTYLVTDEDGAAIPNATVYIPSATTSAIGPINFDATISSNVSNNDVPNVVKFVADATITATTDANGYATSNTWASNTQTGSSNPVLLGHIGYYQFPTGITPQQRISNPGNFDRLGNTPTTTIAAYGYHPLQAAIDLRGTNVKEYTNALALDEALTSPTEAAANAIMQYNIDTRLAASLVDVTLDNLHDALYVSRLETSRVGDISRTWAVSGQTIDTGGSITFLGSPLSAGSTFNTLTQGSTVGTMTLVANNTIDFSATYGTIAWSGTIPETLISDGRVAGAMTLLANGSYKITGGEISNLTVPTTIAGVTIEIPSTVGGRAAFVTANSHVTVVEPPVVKSVVIPTGFGGQYGVRNLTSNTNITNPTALSGTSGVTVTLSQAAANFNAGDTIRVYWRPAITATAAYSTVYADFAFNTLDDATFTFTPSRTAAVLWENVVNSAAITGTTATATLVDGDQNVTVESVTVDRAELRYVDATSNQLSGAATAASTTLYLGVLATNSLQYLQRFLDHELTADYITVGAGEIRIDSKYAYLDSANTTTQVQITSAANTDSDFNLRPVNLSGVTGSTVIILPNPAGATPAQITAATTVAIDNSTLLNTVAGDVMDIETKVDVVDTVVDEILVDTTNLRQNKLLGLKPQVVKPQGVT